jgi:hypothetical protein
MDAAEVIKSLITMEALAPNMMKDIVHSKFEKPTVLAPWPKS